MRWPDDLGRRPVWLRPRVFPRRYAPPYQTWLVLWHEPATGRRRERGFPTRAEAVTWIARMQNDPALASGEQLLHDIHDARAQHRAEIAAARALVVETAPPGRPLRLPKPYSPYRYKPPEPAQLIGRPNPQRYRSGRVVWKVRYYDAGRAMHSKTFSTLREAEEWREATWQRLAPGNGAPPDAAPAEPRRPAAEDAQLRQDLAEIKQLLQRRHAYERNEHESVPAVLRRLTEIERHLRLTETPQTPKPSRRYPVG